MRSRLFTFLPFLFVLAFFNLACSSTPKAPSAIVQGAELGDVTGDGLTMNLNLLVTNPNKNPLPIGKSSYTMTVSGVRIVEGETEVNVKLPASGSAPVTLPVTVKWDDLLKVKDALVSSRGDVPYRIDGRIGLGGSQPILGRASIPIEYSGTIPLRQALSDPTVLLRSRALRELAAQLFNSVR